MNAQDPFLFPLNWSFLEFEHSEAYVELLNSASKRKLSLNVVIFTDSINWVRAPYISGWAVKSLRNISTMSQGETNGEKCVNRWRHCKVEPKSR